MMPDLATAACMAPGAARLVLDDSADGISRVTWTPSISRSASATLGGMGEDEIMVDYDLDRLGPREFEHLIQALALKYLGAGVQVFGDGPDGGREATFTGPVSFPVGQGMELWNGHGVIQAKHRRRPEGPGRDADWLIAQLRTEFANWRRDDSGRATMRDLPDYFLLVTNVRLSPVAGGGGLDKLANAMRDDGEEVGLKDWFVWHADQICRMLDDAPNIRQAYAGFLTTGDILTSLDNGLARMADETTYHIGVGVPGWRRQFCKAYDDLCQEADVGLPATTVYSVGPGVVQYLGPAGSTGGWVLCALPQEQPVAVADAIWESLHEVGRGAPDGDALSAVGLPKINQDSAKSARVIDAHATRVELAGGRWGPGRLVRADTEKDWAWEPIPTFSSNMTRASRNWLGGSPPPQLRVRAVATLPLANADAWEITPERRKELALTLPFSDLAGEVTMLSARRGADLRPGRWQLGPNPNARDRASYSSAVTSPNGRLALTCEVMVALPDAFESGVVTCTELRVEDSTVWAESLRSQDSLTSGEGLRLSLAELCMFLTVAWQTTTEILPKLIASDPIRTPWAGAPTVELQLSTEHRHDTGIPRLLRDMVDLAPFGDTDRDQLTAMAVTITTPMRMAHAARTKLTRQAVAHMGRDFGFLDATEACLQSSADTVVGHD